MKNKTSRRTFLKTGSRYFLLGSLAGMSGYLLFRDNDDESSICDFDFGCGECKRLSKCDHSQAKDYKTNNSSNHSKGE